MHLRCETAVIKTSASRYKDSLRIDTQVIFLL